MEWKELFFAFVDAEEFRRLAQVLNIIIICIAQLYIIL